MQPCHRLWIGELTETLHHGILEEIVGISDTTSKDNCLWVVCIDDSLD